MRARRPRRTPRRLLILIVLVALAWAGVAAFRAGPAPAITVEPALPGIGQRTAITVRVAEPKRGVAGIRVELVQGDQVHLLGEADGHTLPPWAFWGERTREGTVQVEAGKKTIPELKSGEATIRVTAKRAAAWLRRPAPAVQEWILPVRLVPPALQVLSRHVYVRQGGCEAVVYRVGETSVKDGVAAGDWWFPGYALPGGGPHDRFALFAVPWNLGDVAHVRLVAQDDVENRAEASFVDRFFPQSPRRDTIRVSDGFMEKVVPEILSRTPGLKDQGDLLANYLEINNKLRAANRRELRELAAKSQPKFLWHRPFLSLPHAKRMASFADDRTYLYQGKKVDHQVHLGMDLASTKHAEVPAANDGVVLLARFFGIYGNAVVLDHGYGLMTLYGHLSSLDVKEGDQVQRGQTLGRSGQTGLAGGDHLHFAVLLDGLPVRPAEWWDAHWIHDRIAGKLGEALPFEP